MVTILPFFIIMHTSQYLAIREMSCSATRTVISFLDMLWRYSITSSLYFMSRWDVGSSTSISFGSWTYALAIRARCFSPEEHRATAFLLRWSRPNVFKASRTILSSSGDSHQTLLTKGYLPSITSSMTVVPNRGPGSAGTLETILATSFALNPEVSCPSMAIFPVQSV